MQVNISTRHGELSEATREKITQKVEKLQRFFERLTSIDVTIDLDKADEPKIEVAVNAEHKHDFVAQYPSKDGNKEIPREKTVLSDKDSKDKDLFPALDVVVTKLEQQIKKYKGKIQDHGKGAAKHPG